MQKIYEGKAKVVYKDGERYYIKFKDEVTAFDGKKRASFEGKGYYANKISSFLFEYLRNFKIKTHYIKCDDKGCWVYPAKVFPFEVVVRSVSTGSFVRRYGIREGEKIKIIEFFLKDDKLGDPQISESFIVDYKKWISKNELEFLKILAFEIFENLSNLFMKAGLKLVDAKFEFGKSEFNGDIMLVDELSPDVMRIWTQKGESLDKDVFRKGKGNLVKVYSRLWDILKSIDYNDIIRKKRYEVKVLIELKEGLLDPQGRAVKEALLNLGFDDIKEVRIGKVSKIVLMAYSVSEVEDILKNASEKLLINPLVEKFEILWL